MKYSAVMIVCLLCAWTAVVSGAQNVPYHSGRKIPAKGKNVQRRSPTFVPRFYFLQTEGKPVAYMGSHSIEQPDSKAEFAVVFVHGAKGGALDSLRFLKNICNKKAPGKVYFIQPSFMVYVVCPQDLLDKIALWEENGKHNWRCGYRSVGANGIASYEVLDRICRKLSDRRFYPNLKHVLLCGYSAGGQVINRYIAVGKLPCRKDLKCSFAVGAPSTYLYVDLQRPQSDGVFAVPETAAGLFNNWHYGLRNRREYAGEYQKKSIMENLYTRYTLFLCGTEDTGDRALDRGRAAMFQGKNRYERFLNYKKYCDLFPEWRKNCDFISVSGVGHSTAKVFSHPAFVNLVFGKHADIPQLSHKNRKQ